MLPGARAELGPKKRRMHPECHQSTTMLRIFKHPYAQGYAAETNGQLNSDAVECCPLLYAVSVNAAVMIGVASRAETLSGKAFNVII